MSLIGVSEGNKKREVSRIPAYSKRGGTPVTRQTTKGKNRREKGENTREKNKNTTTYCEYVLAIKLLCLWFKYRGNIANRGCWKGNRWHLSGTLIHKGARSVVMVLGMKRGDERMKV